MRKFLSTGVLAAAATMALLPVFTAQASPADTGHDSDAKWTYVDDYDDLRDCVEAGLSGQFGGDWSHFTCDLHSHDGEWHLYVDDHHHDGDNDDDGDDEDNDNNGG
ncbi:hypothetical protein [Kibdelosporangium phytohabitans]|nr:hypothetical protein [Kibdelosporangium phytohabitans]MBE1468747.1 hypothetical protein [Kibdelosporangium phytohabitans]